MIEAPAHAVRAQLSGGWQLWPEAAVRSAGMPFEWLLDLADGGDVTELLDHPAFAAAITWQNPAIADTWLPGPGEPRRLNGYRRSVLARYAQRYCAKNDSIGFFGPVGWADISAGSPVELVTDEVGGIGRVLVHLEHWAVLALADAWAAEPELAPYVPVRIHPTLHRDGGVARLPGRVPLELTPAELDVLDTLAAAPHPHPAHGVGPVVDRLVERGALLRGFRIPVCARPEQYLRAALERLGDPELAADRLARLDRLEAARAEVAAVWSEPTGLRAALSALDAVYRDIGGPMTRRSGGAVGAGRTLVHPDCLRTGGVTVGAPALATLDAPLGMLLTSARWLTAEAASVVEERLAVLVERLRSRGPVTLADLQFAAAETLSGADGIVDAVAEDFTARWSAVFAESTSTPDGIQVDVRTAQPLVEALFRAAGPGWAAARHHSPDLLAARVDGGIQWVLGELHLALNTLESRFFHDLHEAPERLHDQAVTDFTLGRVVPCYPVGTGVDSRRYPPLASHVEDRYLYWSFGADQGPHPEARSRVWPGTALLVHPVDGRWHAGPADRSWSLPVIEFFGEFLTALVVNRFRLVPEAVGAQPRIRLGELVVVRRSWRFRSDEVPVGLHTKRGYRTELLVARLQAAGLPRHLFARLPDEPKPFYVDLQSPLTVANLARGWLAAADRPDADVVSVELSEMLPGPEELMLGDERGHYTSELRFVAVDPVPCDLTDGVKGGLAR